MNELLWDEKLGVYRNFDIVKGGLTAVENSLAVSSFSPFFAGVPSVEKASRMFSILNSNKFTTLDERM